MGQIMIYAMGVALALGVAGLCEERLAALRKRPRRFFWALTLVLSIVWATAGVLWLAKPPATAISPQTVTTPSLAQDQSEPVMAPAPVTLSLSAGEKLQPVAAAKRSLATDRMLLLTWALVSSVLLLHLLLAGAALQWRARRWRPTTVLGREVLVSQEVGPALMGTWRPRIVVPQWFMSEPPTHQELILQHEEQHIAARDPLLLRAAALLVLCLPWNLPLWWQLRRLRNAIELDCDARVLRRGAAPSAYGQVLLQVTRRGGAMPAGLVAMSEPVSALEKRIRNLSAEPPRRRALWTGLAVLFGAAAIGAAAALEAPPLPPSSGVDATGLPRLLPPAGPGAAVRPDINVLMQALASRHPELVTGPGPDVPGTTIAVTLNADGSVGRSEILHTAPGDPWGLGAPLADRITLPGAGSILLQKGTRIGDAAVLNTHVRILYTAPMSRTETAVPVDDRTPRRVQQAALASLSQLLLPVRGDSFNRITVFMTEDGRIDRHYVELRRREELRPYGDINPEAFGRLWEPLGLRPDQLGTMGITNVHQGDPGGFIARPDGTLAPGVEQKWMIVRFAWPRRANEPMGGTRYSSATAAMSSQFPFSHTELAQVLDHHLPRALNDQGFSPEGIPWLVLSREGEVLRSGYLQADRSAQGNPPARLQAEVPDLPLGEFRQTGVVRQYSVAYANAVMLAWVAEGSVPR